MAWARGRQLTHLGLWAPAHRPAAVALYRQAGFRETGRRGPLPNHPALEIIEMACELRYGNDSPENGPLVTLAKNPAEWRRRIVDFKGLLAC
jgi:hypothetical protein